MEGIYLHWWSGLMWAGRGEDGGRMYDWRRSMRRRRVGEGGAST